MTKPIQPQRLPDIELQDDKDIYLHMWIVQIHDDNNVDLYYRYNNGKFEPMHISFCKMTRDKLFFSHLDASNCVARWTNERIKEVKVIGLIREHINNIVEEGLFYEE